MNRFSVAVKCLPWKFVNLFTLTLLLSYLAKLSAASDLPHQPVEAGSYATADVMALENPSTTPIEQSLKLLSIDSFSSQELTAVRAPGCGTLLSTPDKPDHFVFATFTENNGNGAMMQIEGEWVRFFPDSDTFDLTEADVGFSIHKNYTSHDTVYALKTSIHFGEEAGGYTPVVEATLSIQAEGFSETLITATGATCH